jgi:hypothetical protein
VFKIKKWSDRGEFEELHLDAIYLKYVEIFTYLHFTARLDNYYVIDDRNLLKVLYSPYVNKDFVYIFVSKILSFIRQLFIFSSF